MLAFLSNMNVLYDEEFTMDDCIIQPKRPASEIVNSELLIREPIDLS